MAIILSSAPRYCTAAIAAIATSFNAAAASHAGRQDEQLVLYERLKAEEAEALRGGSL